MPSIDPFAVEDLSDRFVSLEYQSGSGSVHQLVANPVSLNILYAEVLII